MAALVTDADVQKLIAVPAGTDLSEHIDAADLIVTERLADKGMSDARLRLVELYLAAHFTALAEEKGGLTQTSMGESSDGVANVYEEGLKMTRFGQTAITLDESGTLAKLGSKGKAIFRVV